MDYEKAYKEALERAKSMMALPDDKATMEYIFPELTESEFESEDERIRKEILDFVKLMCEKIDSGMNSIAIRNKDAEMFEKWIAYLEKQKEQKGLDVTDYCQPIHPDIAKVLPDVINELTWGEEKQKEQDKCPEYCVRSHCIDCPIYEKQKEKDWDIVPELRQTAWGEGYQHGCKDTEEKYTGMMVCSQEEWDEAIANAFKHGMDEGEKQKEQKVDVDKLRRDIYQSGYNDGYQHGKDDAQKEQKSNIEICPHSIKSKSYSEQKPAEYITDAEMKRSMDSLHDFKVFAANLAKQFNITHKRDIDWHNFCAGLLTYLERNKPAEWSEEDKSNLQSCIAKIEIDMQHWGNHGKTMVDGDIKLIDWLKSLPERFELQPKQEWSEEDERRFISCIGKLQTADGAMYNFSSGS